MECEPRKESVRSTSGLAGPNPKEGEVDRCSDKDVVGMGEGVGEGDLEWRECKEDELRETGFGRAKYQISVS